MKRSACAHGFHLLLLILYQPKIINAAVPIDIVTEKSNLQKLIPKYPVQWLMIPDVEPLIKRRDGPRRDQNEPTKWQLQLVPILPTDPNLKREDASRFRDPIQSKPPKSYPNWQKLNSPRWQEHILPRWQQDRNSKSQGLSKWQEKMILRQHEYQEKNAPQNWGEGRINDEDIAEDQDYRRQMPHNPWKWKWHHHGYYYTDGYYARDRRFPWENLKPRIRTKSFQQGIEIAVRQLSTIMFELLSGHKPPMKVERIRDYDNHYPPRDYW